jgi:pimeloyl-ACP methyl ester carboxylesterase
MIAWHEYFCEMLAERGFRVVRFDNRDIGRSTHMGFRAPSTRQLLTRRFPPDQYTLTDMAEDTARLIRELDIAPSHVVGVSMGGMIGQTLAAQRPELVRSLVSIMSNTGNRWRGQPAPSVYRHLLRPPPTDRDGFVQRAADIFGVVGSTGFDNDLEHIREYAERSFDRGHDAAGGARQLAAIMKSGDRTRELRTIKTPTLVIHGTVDRLVRPSGGRATARAIPGARLLMIEGMGHDLPRGAWPQLVDAIAEHAHAADSSRAPAPA